MTPRLALLCLFAVLSLPGPARADPALFVARAPGITAYLFGSIHALRPGVEWEKPALTRAYRDAAECWFEVILPEADTPVTDDAWSRGIDPSHRLPALLSGAEHARLRSRIAALGIPGGPAAVDRVRPWMAYLLVTLGDARSTGAEARNGVDIVLERRAAKDRKRLVALETPDDQVNVFANQPERLTMRLLHDALAAAPPPPGPGMEALVQHWLAGDLDSVARTMDEATSKLGPEIADALLARRNRAWGDRLSTLKTAKGRPRTILVTVGAGHLAGPDSLVEQLRTHGFTVERIQP